MVAFYITLSIFLGILIVTLIAFLVMFWAFLPKKAYFSALFSRNHLSMKYLISAKLRKLPISEIVNIYITARKAGLDLTIDNIEELFTSGLDANNIVQALIMSKNANLKFDLKTIQKIALAGKNAVTFVNECLTSKPLDTDYISAICSDMQELMVKVRLTLVVNRNNLSSPLFEDTILARTQEAVISRIAETNDHKVLMKRPLLITKAVFDADVDSACFYEVASVEVMEMNIGINHAFKKEKENIEKENIREKNRIEQRRLTAVAVEQEMKARTQEMRAKFVEKQMEVPETIKKAIEEGKIDNAMDYYKLENLQADTAMRRKLAGNVDDDDDDDNDDFDFDDDE